MLSQIFIKLIEKIKMVICLLWKNLLWLKMNVFEQNYFKWIQLNWKWHRRYWQNQFCLAGIQINSPFLIGSCANSPNLGLLTNVSSIWNPFVVMSELTPLSKSTCKNWICFHAMKNLAIRSHLHLTVLEPQDFKDCYKLFKKNYNHLCQIHAN